MGASAWASEGPSQPAGGGHLLLQGLQAPGPGGDLGRAGGAEDGGLDLCGVGALAPTGLSAVGSDAPCLACVGVRVRGQSGHSYSRCIRDRGAQPGMEKGGDSRSTGLCLDWLCV